MKITLTSVLYEGMGKLKRQTRISACGILRKNDSHPHETAFSLPKATTMAEDQTSISLVAGTSSVRSLITRAHVCEKPSCTSVQYYLQYNKVPHKYK
jgi:hypothetical protein